MKTFWVIIFVLALTTVASAGSVTLKWDGVTQATGYKVYYGTSTGAKTANINVGNVTQYTVPNLQSGSRYYFQATAYNALTESGYSNEVNAVVPLDAPGQLTIVVITGQ